jgi:hypothetical protein
LRDEHRHLHVLNAAPNAHTHAAAAVSANAPVEDDEDALQLTG